MKPKHLYLTLAVAGAAIPLAAFVPWITVNGLDGELFVQQMFANHISTFFALDVLISALVLLAVIGVERRRGRLSWPWLPVVAVCCVGVSLGFPLFLYLRERSVERESSC